MKMIIISITVIALIHQSMAGPVNFSTSLLQIPSTSLRQISENPQRLIAFPINHVIEAQKLDTTKIDVADSMVETQLQPQTRILSDKLIKKIIAAIDLTPVMDYLNNISVGKLLTALYNKFFPLGIYHKLSELFCKQLSGETSEPTEFIYPQEYKERNVDVPRPNLDKNTFLFDVVYPDELNEQTNENLKQTPLTDDYIEDEPIADDEIKTKISGDYKSGIELLTNERFTEQDGREFLRKLVFG